MNGLIVNENKFGPLNKSEALFLDRYLTHIKTFKLYVEYPYLFSTRQTLELIKRGLEYFKRDEMVTRLNIRLSMFGISGGDQAN